MKVAAPATSFSTPRQNRSREKVWNKTLTRFINSRKWVGPLTKTPSVCSIILTVLLCPPFLLDRMSGQWIIWFRVMADAILSCLWWPCHGLYSHSSDPLCSSRRDSPMQIAGLIICVCMYTGLLLYSVCSYWVCYRWMNFDHWTLYMLKLWHLNCLSRPNLRWKQEKKMAVLHNSYFVSEIVLSS